MSPPVSPRTYDHKQSAPLVYDYQTCHPIATMIIAQSGDIEAFSALAQKTIGSTVIAAKREKMTHKKIEKLADIDHTYFNQRYHFNEIVNLVTLAALSHAKPIFLHLVKERDAYGFTLKELARTAWVINEMDDRYYIKELAKIDGFCKAFFDEMRFKPTL